MEKLAAIWFAFATALAVSWVGLLAWAIFRVVTWLTA